MGEQTIGCQVIEVRSYLDVGIERSGLFRQLTLSTPYPALSHDSVANLDFAYTVLHCDANGMSVLFADSSQWCPVRF